LSECLLDFLADGGRALVVPRIMRALVVIEEIGGRRLAQTI
jgi:hypothetical protein